jgi:stress-induced morphogen
MADASSPGPVEAAIRTKVSQKPLLRTYADTQPQLESTFTPAELKVANDSAHHRHHAAMRAVGGGNGETRESAYDDSRHKFTNTLFCTDFSVAIVSDAFQGKVSL